jgi:hypothetical protein
MINSSFISQNMITPRSVLMDRRFVFLSLFFGLIITFNSPGFAQGDHVIYDDALAADWFYFPMGQTNYQNTSPTHTGNSSISVRAGVGEGIALTHMNFDTSLYSDLSFWIYGGTEGGQILIVMAILMFQPQTPVAIDALTSGEWQLITIPLADLGAADQTGVNGFVVMNFLPANQPTFYLDDIRLTALWVDPNKVTYPYPDNDADNVAVTTDLSWNVPTAFTPTSYIVYFGTELDTYNNPKTMVYTNSFEPQSDLLYGTTYYWVVDANDNGNIYSGDTWSFTTRAPVEPGDLVAGNMMLINDNAGWCWYQDEKIIYDPVAHSVITSTAASGWEGSFGDLGEDRRNDVDTTIFNIASGKRTQVLACNRGGDDHNMGALWIRPDGRYLHMYAEHYSPDLTYFRVTTNPNDGTEWGPEQSYNWLTISGLAHNQDLTYTNVHYLAAEGTGQGRLYNIVREFGRNPHISYSDDWGETWQYAGRLSEPLGNATYSNYYHKFKANGIDRIDFIATEQHPRDYNNGVYHGYIQNGKIYNSFGVEMDDTIFDQDAPTTEDFTPIFIPDEYQGPNTYHTAWINELEIDAQGHPVCLFQTRYGTEPYGDGGGQATIGAADHRFFYGRFDGSSWTYTELCKMGTGLFAREQDYLGMGCIHPDNANVIYVSTPFDPRDDEELEHHEIFKGLTADKGLTWVWTPITSNSTEDNIRPAIPKWDAKHTAVFWTRGVYTDWAKYDMVLVGMIDNPDETMGLVTYVDANRSNTAQTDGNLLIPVRPFSSVFPIPLTNQWHESVAYGNAGSFYMTPESEDAPMLKTTVSGLTDGTYDVFAFFWSDPFEDWGVVGGFTPSDMLYFSKQSSQQAEVTQFTGPVDVIGIETALYRVYIGRVQVSNGASIDVYIDDYDNSLVNGPDLTTYDGVGVAPVISN